MIKTILILSIMYLVFFLVFIVLKATSKKLDKLIFCPTCISWFSVMVLSFIFGFPLIVSAFLLGLSITGIIYKIVEVLESKKKNFKISNFQLFLLQLIFTIIGLTILWMFQ